MNKYISELIATYALIFFGSGAIIINTTSGGLLTHLGVAIAFGVVVMALIYGFGETSGCHINPAVTLAFWYAGTFPGKQVLPYIIFQAIGAFLASLTLKILFPDQEFLGGTLPAGTAMQSFVIEIILTFFLMLVVINVATGSKEVGTLAGIAIGGIVLLEALVFGPITGASMNPIRSLAPAIVSGKLQHIWVYLSAPIIGALLAIMVYKIMVKPQQTSID
ncbi:aquaporin [Labilibacter marinus]|uniref:aquaporin n=1 Tax=Labilibacter marinus TaxID=1477105 RepID=UPI00094F856E|nr:aquaporin [Labilibacter marinus]